MILVADGEGYSMLCCLRFLQTGQQSVGSCELFGEDQVAMEMRSVLVNDVELYFISTAEQTRIHV